MKRQRFLAYLLSAAILVSQIVWVLPAAATEPDPAPAAAASKEAPQTPEPGQQSSSFKALSLTPADGQVLYLLGGGSVRVRASFQSPEPVTSIDYRLSSDGSTWLPIQGEQDSGVQRLTGRLVYQRALLWDASALADGTYQLKAVATAGGKTAELVSKVTIDRRSVVPTVKEAVEPTAPARAKPNMGAHQPPVEGMKVQKTGGAKTLGAKSMAANAEPITLAFIGPIDPEDRMFMAEGWAEADYRSAAAMATISIAYRLQGETDWTAVAPTYDSGLQSGDEGDGTWYSNRYVAFDTSTFTAGTYELQFTATDVDGNTRTDTITFEVGQFSLTWLGPDTNEWYGPYDLDDLWIEADYESALEPQSITFQHRLVGESTWNDLTTTEDSGLRKSDYGEYWYSWRYVEWDATSWADGAYEVQYTFTDVGGNNHSGIIVYNVDQTPPDAPALTVVTAPDGESFDLSWVGSPDVAEYQIERYAPYDYNDYEDGEGGSPTPTAIGGEGYWNTIAYVDGSTTTFTDTQVARGVEYTYRVWAEDLAYNDSPASNEVVVSLPYTGPVLDYIYPGDYADNDDWVYMEARFRDDVEITQIAFEYSTDGTIWTAIPFGDSGFDGEGEVYYAWGEWDMTALPDGVYYWRTTALDVSGRSTTANSQYTLDRVVSITGLQVEVHPDGGLLVSWDDIPDADYVYLEVYRDGSYYDYEYLNSGDSSYHYYGAEIDHTYRFDLYVDDTAGNDDYATITYEWYVGPQITLEGGNPGLTNQATYTISGVVEGAVPLTIDGAAVAVHPDGRFSHDVAVTEGSNYFVLQATNDQGTRTLTLEVIVDTTPPTYYYMSPSNNSREGAEFELYGESYDDYGITRVTFQMRRAGAGDWLTVDEQTYDEPWDGYYWVEANVDATANLADGLPLGEGAHTWRYEVQDVFGNVGTSPERSLIVDLTGPAAPTELTATPGTRSVVLTWSASTDADGLRYYKLFRATAPGGPYEEIRSQWYYNTRSFNDVSVAGNTTYYYIVRAQDDLGNLGPASVEVSATPTSDTSPPVFTGFHPSNGSTVAGPEPTLYAYFHDDDGQLVQSVMLEWSTDGSTWTAVPSVNGPYANYANEEYAYVYWNTLGLASGAYQLRWTVTDRSGNAATGIVGYNTDFFARVPANLVATTGLGGAVGLAWDSVGDSDHYAYEVYRSTTPGTGYSNIATLYYGNVSFTDTRVDSGTTYYYVVRSMDYNYNRSGWSNEVMVMADPDTLAPTVSSVYLDPLFGDITGSPDISFTFYLTDNLRNGLTSAAVEYSVDSGTTWNAIPFGGPWHNSGTTYYVSGTWYTTGLPEGPVIVRVTATDKAGNTGTWTKEYTLDLTTQAVTNLSAFPGQSNVQLRWTPSEDTNFSYYRILRKTTGSYSYVTDLYSRTQDSYLNNYLTAGTAYTYVIDTYDKYGNVARSEAVSATPQLDTTPPEITSIDPATDTAIGANRYIYVYFTENADPNLMTGTMEYSVDGTTWTVVGNLTYSDYWYSRYLYRNWDISGLADGTYQVRYTIKDGNNNTDTETVAYHIDRTAPVAVTLTAEGLDVNHIRLVWTASDADVQYYRVERAEAAEGPFAHLTTTNGNVLTFDNVVTPGVTYYYRVIPKDRFRDGPASNVASAMAVPDTEAPQVTWLAPTDGRRPASFDVNAQATDNLGVVSIRLEYSTDEGVTWTELARNANVAVSYTWETSAVPEGTVWVRAVATDAAGNSSADRPDNPVRIYQLDRTAPAAPALTATAPDERHIKIDWTLSDGDVEYVRLEWAADPAGPWTSLGNFYVPTQTYTHYVTPATTYYYRAWAYDLLYQGATSEPLAASAVPDTEKPHITYLNPANGYKPAVITLQAGASDNLSVARIALEYSLDGTTWTEVVAANAGSISHNWNTAGIFPVDTTITVRAIATDAAGNASNDSPVRTYLVDNAVPSAPTGLQILPAVTRISVAWDVPPMEEGVARFNVYRSTDGTTYTLYRNGLTTAGFHDDYVDQGVTYHYVVTAVDSAGNESAQSAPVSAVPTPDTTAPWILSVSPGTGMVGANPSIWVSAQDNNKLGAISLAYRQSGGEWIAIGTQNRGGRTDGASFPWDTAGLADGDYELQASAIDAVGNPSAPVSFTLTLDLTPPPAPVVTLTPQGWAMQIDWTASSAPDLYGYRVLRQRADGGWHHVGTTGALTATEGPLNPANSYTYVVEVIDQRNNVSRSMPVSAQPLATDPFAPTAFAGYDSSVYVGTNVTFDGTGSRDNDQIASYEWTFPDSTSETGPVVNRVLDVAGTYTIQLKVTDPAGNTAYDSVTVTVRPVPVVGNLTVVVKNKQSGQRIGGASVVVQVPGGELLHYTSNGNGEVNLVAPHGDYTAHAYKTGFLPDNVDITIIQGGSGTYDVLLEPGEIVTGELTVERMTLDEIVEAGVDITRPENQFVYKFNINLAFQDQPPVTQEVIVNYQGAPVGGGGQLQPIIINTGGGGGGPGSPTYIAYPTVMPSPRPEVEPTVAYLVIPGKASFLKEFFEVQLRLMNHAAEQYVIDNAMATLNLPAGVVLAPTAQPQSLTVDLDQLAGQEEKVVKWVIRGDTEGDYHLSADFTGTLLPFEDEVTGHFTTAEPFHVWGPSAVKLIVEPQDTATKGAPYHLRLSMQNVTDQPLPGGRLDPAHVYNAAIELLEEGKQNFIYAPNQQLLQMKGDLEPGATFGADFYLIPCISGQLVLSQSYVLRTGGNAEFPTQILPGHPAPFTGLNLTAVRSSGQVTLTWDVAAGATAYRIYTVRPDLLMSVDADRVGEVSGTSITLPESSPHSYIVTVVGADGKETLQHKVSDITWCGNAALPVVTVDPEQVTVGQASTVLITAVAGGYPVTEGTISVGTYATNVALDANGQASVTFTATAPGPIEVTLTMDGEVVATDTITAVAATDAVAPITTSTVTDTTGLNGWYYEPVQVTLTAEDNQGGSGVNEIRYSLDGTSFTTYTAPFTVATPGITTVTFYAVDVVGNEESHKTLLLKLDLAAPVTTGSLIGTTLTLSATDDASGVTTTEYSLNGGQTWLTYTGPVTVPSDLPGANVRSTDAAGRTEVPRSILRIDSAFEWTGQLTGGAPVTQPANEPLPVTFMWAPGDVPTLNQTATVRMLDAQTNQVITSFTFGGAITYDQAAGQYLLTLVPATYGLDAGRQVKIQVFIARRLQGTIYMTVQ